MSTVFVDTFFPNGSPLRWREAEDGAVELFPIPDHARFSPNRQFTHWHLRLVLPAGDERETIVVRFATVMNCWNGKESPAMRNDPVAGVVSADGRDWHGIYGQRSDREGFAAEFALPASPIVHFASLVPYAEADLEHLLARLESGPEARVYVMGATVEGRPLHMIELGRADAPDTVFLRARAHPWETGGSWLMEGLVERLTDGSDASRDLLDRVRFCLQPMANRDGVHRGMTRFTVTGIDPNRHWDPELAHDPVLAPENATLANWFAEQARQGTLPRLAIDLHNDCDGRLHLSHPTRDPAGHASRMAIFEQLLRDHTWFREGHTEHGFRNSGTFGEGLSERCGIDAIIWELRANYAEGLGRQPLAADWREMGRQFAPIAAEFLRATR
jgi:hypothetical protein